MTHGANRPGPELCTVVDLNYASRALTLYRSLEETSPGFRLHVLCMEPGVRTLLDRLELQRTVVHDLETLEALDRDLRNVKGSRSPVEYCWTVKPVLCRYLLEQTGLEAVTYVDSDLMFFGDARLVLDELGDGSIMILPHRFPERWAEWGVTDGIFNGAWFTFRRDGHALDALRWWRERCLEWCYDRREDGKYADQHYLDDWPERFAGVHVIGHPGAGLAPWNATLYRLEPGDGAPLVNGQPAIFYHYQSLRLVRAPRGFRSLGLQLPGYRLMRQPPFLLWWTAPEYELADSEVELFWAPYLRRLVEAMTELRQADARLKTGIARMEAGELGLALARRLLPPAVRRRLRKAWLALRGEDG